ncbi:MAG: hypothetical protein QOG88_1514, partial [Actinomycetota bacterium]|nr:hypothetical protein [Actinomycetota bacterium]
MQSVASRATRQPRAGHGGVWSDLVRWVGRGRDCDGSILWCVAVLGSVRGGYWWVRHDLVVAQRCSGCMRGRRDRL